MHKSSIGLLESKEHLKIDFDEAAGYVIEFRLNEGKGTSPIRIPIGCFGQFIDVLETGPRVVEENNIVDTIRNSLAFDIDDDGQEVVVFRTRHGRGSKIHKIFKNEYEQVIKILKDLDRSALDVIKKYEDPNY